MSDGEQTQRAAFEELAGMLPKVGEPEATWTMIRTELARNLIAQFAAQTQRAPDGWKLVPIEPTQEMLSAYLAAQRAYCEDMNNYGKFGMLFTPAKATSAGYAAMLAALPQSETPHES